MNDFTKKWENLELGDICEITMGQSPKSEFYNENRKGMPFLQGNRTFGDRFPSFDTYCTNNKKIAKKNDIIMSVRAPVGDLNIANCDISIGRGVCAIKSNNMEDGFLYYLLKYNVQNILNKQSGTVFGSINKNDILKLKISLPPKKQQQKITHVLKSQDDEIEVLNKINKNLENISQEIFKSWFIKFDPFLNEEFEKESDFSFPKSFKTGVFSELIEELVSGDWGKNEIEGNYIKEVYCVRGADIPDVKKGNKGKMPIRYILPKNYDMKKIENNDIVLEISGGSPTQSTGRVVAITQSFLNRFDKPMICTNFCKIIRPIEHYNLFVYYYWNYFYNIGAMFSYENGTTGIKNFDVKGFINNEMIIVPPLHIVKKFNDIIMSFSKEIFNNALESEKLIKMRDNLLPKLMSGEIDVTHVKI